MLTDTRVSPLSAARKRLTLLALCLGLFLAQLDTTVVNLALPHVGRELHGDVTDLQWVMNAYLLPFAGLLLTGGTLGDLWGRRRLFGTGLVVFVAGSVLCALAGHLAVLVAGRAVQGLGAAMAIPQSLAILSLTFPGRAERNRAMAAWSAVAGVALAAGPTLGGWLLVVAGWPAVFWLNVPVGLAALALLGAVAESSDPQDRSLDIPGQVLAAGFLVLLTYGIVHTAVAVVLAAGCLIAFVIVERRQENPMVPLGILGRGPLPTAVGVTACMTFGMYGMLLLAGMFLQRDGTSALTAGLEMLAMPVTFVLGSPLVARLTTRLGPRLPMTAGMASMGLGLLLFAVTAEDPLLRHVPFAMLGLGMALNTGPALGVAVSAVEPERAGLAAGIANLARMVGASLGVAVLSTVLAAVSQRSASDVGFLLGMRIALVVGAVVQLSGSVIAAIGIRNNERKTHA